MKISCAGKLELAHRLYGKIKKECMKPGYYQSMYNANPKRIGKL